FPDVARPIIFRKSLNGSDWNLLDLAVQSLSVLLGEVPDEQWNVALALSQRRDGQRKHVQPIIQVAAKFTVVDHFLQIPVRGGHQPDIDSDSAISTQPLKLLLLDGPQQLGLQLQRDFTDLIEEQSALVR